MNTQPVLIRDGDIYSGYNFIGENIPIGAILPLMGLTAPTGYLICDGTTHLIKDYPDLTEFFKTQFGSSNFFGGDGVTTFKVPDLRGEFLRGTGTNGHANQGSGAAVGAHQDATEHVYHWTGTASFGAAKDANDVVNPDKFSSNTSNAITVTKDNESSLVPKTYASRPTNTSVTYIIKAFVSPATGDSGESKTPIRYSTEEQWTGKYWTDGKKIYQQTIQSSLTTYTDVGSRREFAYIVPFSIDTLVHAYGSYVLSNSRWSTKRRFGDAVMNSDKTCNMVSMVNYPGLYFAQDISTQITKCDINIILEYTKTTD